MEEWKKIAQTETTKEYYCDNNFQLNTHEATESGGTCDCLLNCQQLKSICHWNTRKGNNFNLRIVHTIGATNKNDLKEK